MRGEREYEFVGVGVFVAEGDARFLTRTLTAYGYHRDQLGRQHGRVWSGPGMPPDNLGRADSKR